MRRHRIPEGESLWREHLANERTMLSWVRTGINMIGVGILIGILSGLPGPVPRDPSGTLSSSVTRGGEFFLLGMGLTVAGALVEIAALARFARYGAEIERGTFTSSAPIYLLISAGLVLLGGVFLGLVVLS